MNVIDLIFPVVGSRIPTDHAYLLYSALSHQVEEFHADNVGIRFAPINGDKAEKGLLKIFDRSRLRIRLQTEHMGLVLPLVGRSLRVGDHTVELRAPTVLPLEPATMLRASVVIYKHSTGSRVRKARKQEAASGAQSSAITQASNPTTFLEWARQRFEAMDIGAVAGIPLIRNGDRAGQPRRQVLRIKGKRIIGYPLMVTGLTAEESIRLQEQGLGGRTRIGCGFFVPFKGDRS